MPFPNDQNWQDMMGQFNSFLMQDTLNKRHAERTMDYLNQESINNQTLEKYKSDLGIQKLKAQADIKAQESPYMVGLAMQLKKAQAENNPSAPQLESQLNDEYAKFGPAYLKVLLGKGDLTSEDMTTLSKNLTSADFSSLTSMAGSRLTNVQAQPTKEFIAQTGRMEAGTHARLAGLAEQKQAGLLAGTLGAGGENLTFKGTQDTIDTIQNLLTKTVNIPDPNNQGSTITVSEAMAMKLDPSKLSAMLPQLKRIQNKELHRQKLSPEEEQFKINAANFITPPETSQFDNVPSQVPPLLSVPSSAPVTAPPTAKTQTISPAFALANYPKAVVGKDDPQGPYIIVNGVKTYIK